MYDYANARLRAMKSQLFDRHTFTEFAQLARVDDLIGHLAQSPYKAEIEAALARYTGLRVVLDACRMHLANTYLKIQGFFEAEGANLVSILLARWDLHNLKAILRGQENHVRPAEILETLVPAGSLDEAALRMLVRQAEPIATADLLRIWNVPYARMIRTALTSIPPISQDFASEWGAFEAQLDNLFFTHLLSGLQEGTTNADLVRDYLVREIDSLNVMSALRLREGGALWDEREIAARFIRGGLLSNEWLVSLARVPREEDLLASLRSSRLWLAFSGIETYEVTSIQHALDLDFARFGQDFFLRDPLTIATAIGFITAKRVEVINVRLVAQGLALGLSPADIEKELI